MEWNSALLLLACFSCASLIWRSIRQRQRMIAGWLGVGIFVLLATGIAWQAHPSSAGFFGFGLWVALVMLPAMCWRQGAKLASAQRFSAAYPIAKIGALLHPLDGWPQEVKILSALRHWQRGNAELAARTLGDLAARGDRTSFEAECHRLRIEGRWNDLVNWVNHAGDQSALADYPLLAGIYLRALGETGQVQEMVEAFERISHQLAPSTRGPVRADAMMFALIFGGRRESAQILIDRHRPAFSPSTREFLLATAAIAAGDPQGTAEMRRMAEDPSLAIAGAARQRLENPPPAANSLSPRAQMILSRLKGEVHFAPTSERFYQRWRLAPATAALVAANFVMFFLEMAKGGTTSDAALDKLGALDLNSLTHDHQYWRILAASFLHYGWPHILFNMGALIVLGPGVERLLKTWKYLAVYFACAIGSMLGVMLLQYLKRIEVDQIVGASGAIMGLVGASGAILLKQWMVRRDLDVRRRLINVVWIIALQAIVDRLSPMISGSAHLFGAGIGFAIAYLMFSAKPRMRIAR